MNGGSVFLKGMNKSDGSGQFSAYALFNEEKTKVFFSSQNPEDFVKFGKYKMRIQDKILIEKGCVTRAKVKWYGIGNFAYPHLWKADTSDSDYQESWDDPCLPKTQKEDQKPRQPIVQKKSRGRGM
ncbi:hypothetical protein M2449_003962 [Dysgonomonas sp. PF1-16]|nr:hypothetical protein [Dysgonomonas sp. PF1-16]